MDRETHDSRPAGHHTTNYTHVLPLPFCSLMRQPQNQIAWHLALGCSVRSVCAVDGAQGTRIDICPAGGLSSIHPFIPVCLSPTCVSSHPA